MSCHDDFDRDFMKALVLVGLGYALQVFVQLWRMFR